MLTIPLIDVIIPENRQRSEVPEDHIGQLMESIFSPTGPGLLNPPTLRGGNTLMAGECRLKAIGLGYKLGKVLRHAGRPVPVGHVPYIDFGTLDPLAQAEAEYVENAKRRDLTWQDNLRALANLKALRDAQALRDTGAPAKIADIAQEVYHKSGGSFSDNIAKSEVLVKHLNNPDIAKAKSLNEAKKILGKIEDAASRVKLAAIHGKVVASEKMAVFNTDCVEWMKAQASGQFDVILTDPPYGMGADTFGDAAGRMAGIEHEYKDDGEHFVKLLSVCIPEFYRLAKDQAHLYLWCDIDWFTWLRDECRAAGWWVHRTPLINIKPEGGRVPWPEHGPRRSYEICLYAVKGKKMVTSIRPDVFESRLTEGNFGHGAQKPVEAYVELLKRSVRPGDKIFDAFAGTGTIFPAAHALDCFAVGVEQEAAAYGTCIKRIEGLK